MRKNSNIKNVRKVTFRKRGRVRGRKKLVKETRVVRTNRRTRMKGMKGRTGMKGASESVATNRLGPSSPPVQAAKASAPASRTSAVRRLTSRAVLAAAPG